MTTQDLRYTHDGMHRTAVHERHEAEAIGREAAERARHRADILRERAEAAEAAIEAEITRRINAVRKGE